MKPRTYCRVYHEIVDDPKFRRVYHDDAALATWLRMLLVADAMYPASAPMPEISGAVQLLVRVGLVQKRPGNRYIVTGLEREREMRSHSGRIGAAVRWQSDRNASRAEQSRTEQSKGHWGQHKDCLVCEPLQKPKIIEGGKTA